MTLATGIEARPPLGRRETETDDRGASQTRHCGCSQWEGDTLSSRTYRDTPTVINGHTYLWIVRPELISLAAMARVERHVCARVVQAELVPSYFSVLTQHPELVDRHLVRNHPGGVCTVTREVR